MTQNQQILNYLKLNEGISPITAVNEFLILDLASRIRDLRNMGYAITTERRKSSVVGENGKRKTYAFYKLNMNESRGALEL